jgi:hypothetical protein
MVTISLSCPHRRLAFRGRHRRVHAGVHLSAPFQRAGLGRALRRHPDRLHVFTQHGTVRDNSTA